MIGHFKLINTAESPAQEVDKRSVERPLEARTAYRPEASKVVLELIFLALS